MIRNIGFDEKQDKTPNLMPLVNFLPASLICNILFTIVIAACGAKAEKGV